MIWIAEPEYRLRINCRCNCCFDPTDKWLIDCDDLDVGPFVIGSKDEAETLCEYINDFIDIGLLHNKIHREIGVYRTANSMKITKK